MFIITSNFPFLKYHTILTGAQNYFAGSLPFSLFPDIILNREIGNNILAMTIGLICIMFNG